MLGPASSNPGSQGPQGVLSASCPHARYRDTADRKSSLGSFISCPLRGFLCRGTGVGHRQYVQKLLGSSRPRIRLPPEGPGDEINMENIGKALK